MSDHQYNSVSDPYVGASYDLYEEQEPSNENVILEEKEGDDYLIELYRERKYLYDKNDKNFKDKQLKENAWSEISTIMQQRNLGKHYTPEYCQARCGSLRDQYSREKRNLENDYKSGNAASKRKIFVYFAQLSFLDNFIKRRRTVTNIKCNKTPVHCKLQSNDDSSESENEKQNNNMSQAKINESITINQTIEENCNKFPPKINIKSKKRKIIDETQNIDAKFTDISNKIIHFLEKEDATENIRHKNTENVKTPDQSFADYVRSHLECISEPEKAERKKLIIDALTTSLHIHKM